MQTHVAIVGGGPAASAAAIMLGRAGIGATIVERGDDRGDKPGESLAPAVRPLLEQLGVWDDLRADGHLPCHGNRSSWGADAVDEMPFIFTPYGHGWHLDRRKFERLLAGRAAEAGAQRVTQTAVVDLLRDGDGWRLQCDGGAWIEARFVIDATGRASSIARRMGAQRIVEDALIAVVAFLVPDGDGDRDSFTLVEAVEHGWWYTAVLPDARLAAMFITDPVVVSARAARSREGWNAMLAHAPLTRARIESHRYRLHDAPRCVDAGSARLDRVAGDGWLAIGDAAAALDPLSSHGIAAALAGGIEAARAITDGSTERFERVIDASWTAYVAMRRAFYAAERRWSQTPFWRRRT
jgi:flavin-dependent dehydrogenase